MTKTIQNYIETKLFKRKEPELKRQERTIGCRFKKSTKLICVNITYVCMYVCMYVFICLRRLLCIWQHEADVDLRPVNTHNEQRPRRPQYRELRALLFSISVWVL